MLRLIESNFAEIKFRRRCDLCGVTSALTRRACAAAALAKSDFENCAPDLLIPTRVRKREGVNARTAHNHFCATPNYQLRRCLLIEFSRASI